MSGLRNQGLLIQPSNMLPWSVEVVSAIPKSIMDLGNADEPKRKKKKVHVGLDPTQINTGAVCPGWACLASWKGRIYVWPSTTSTNSTTIAKFSTENCVTLFHPSLVGLNEGDNPLLLALTPASPDSVFVYAAQVSNGNLVAWRVTKDDVQRARTMPMPNLAYAQAALPLKRKEMEDDDDVTNEAAGELLEHPTSLTVVDRLMVVLGTSIGGMICCIQTTIPLALHAQRMLKESASSQSFIGRFFGSSQENDSSPEDDSPIGFHLPLQKSEKDGVELLAITLLGTIWHWNIQTTVASSHQVRTEARCLTTIATLLMNNIGIENMTNVEVLKARARGSRVHLLVRINSEYDCRLFWLRLRFDGRGLHWIDCQWLNRFPAPQDVEAMGLVLADNDLAYAAFHQGSGGITSSVIVMAIQDLEGNEASDNASVEIYEVDLPIKEIPALLPGTFSNDIVTHGCSVLARSGLAIRVRALPPATTAALSPRAVRRANPSNVVKLTNHLRSAFWHSYQYQGAAGGSLALPPSIVEASPVDLEEAVISVATQIHMQKSVDATGWTSVSSALEANALEIHLSLITWLRQAGIYRSIGEYGKWRLLSIGQEIAAFLELTATTRAPTSKEQELMSGLGLASVAVWLNDTLGKTLKDGSTDQYQLWCGWFSTALATSRTYRKERSVSTYDIPMNAPPIVGSKFDVEENKVPVWTSHNSLQRAFGTILQFWKNHPKQKSVHVLPPQTVEVVARAALESFADSAKCLGSERAIGEYAEIKALTIPLLRTLHVSTAHPGKQSDDMVAFQLAVHHDYYEGICQMALDHENKEDADCFRLTSLLTSTDVCQSIDFQTGLTFGQFVLSWFTDRGLYGHTLMYGRLCPERDLNHILQSDERLRPYRWIQAVHKGDYGSAASSLMTTKGAKSTESTLAETKWSFCMAKLSNHVVLKESQSQRKEAEQREETINKTLELIGVQNELAPQTEHLFTPNRLLGLALDQADQAMKEGTKDQIADAVKSCHLGLIICSTFDDKVDQRRQAAQLWAKSIDLEFDTRWAEWIRTEDDLSRGALAQEILDTTVFGGLLQECGDEEGLSAVGFSEVMEQETLEQLGVPGESMRRLLRNVVTTFVESTRENADEEMMDVQHGTKAMTVA